MAHVCNGSDGSGYLVGGDTIVFLPEDGMLIPQPVGPKPVFSDPRPSTQAGSVQDSSWSFLTYMMNHRTISDKFSMDGSHAQNIPKPQA